MNDEEDPLAVAWLYALSGAERDAGDCGAPAGPIVCRGAQERSPPAGVDRGHPGVGRFPRLIGSARPFHVLVLDDEADDGSILDARVEQRLDPATRRSQADPARDRRPGGRHVRIREQTASDWLFATYVGYTATPQANFLQSDHNPLAPRDFSIALRTPLDQGGLQPRSRHVPRAGGAGGELYRRRGVSTAGCADRECARPRRATRAEDMADAVRAFLVFSRGFGLTRGGLPVQSTTARARPCSQVARKLLSRSPKPHSMLFHPSAADRGPIRGGGCAASDRVWARSDGRVGQRDRRRENAVYRSGGHRADDCGQRNGAGRDGSTSTAPRRTAVESAFDLPQARSVNRMRRAGAEIGDLIHPRGRAGDAV